jgi:hypothetical protein
MLERTDAITNEVLEPITFVLAYSTVLVLCDIEEMIQQNLRYIHKHFYEIVKRFAFCDSNIVLRTSGDSNLAPNVSYPKVYLVPSETFLWGTLKYVGRVA